MIIVTGGFGFIGSNIVRRLASYDKHVLVADILDSPDLNWKNLNGLPIEIIDADDLLRDSPLVYSADAIIHMGANSSTSQENVGAAIRNNTNYTLSLIEMSNYSVPVVYASSAAVYGNDARDRSEDDTALRPLNLYGATKAWVDLQFTSAGRNTVGLRYFNVYGPGESHKMKNRQTSPIYNWMHNPDGIKLFVGDDEEEDFYRDFIYVDDVVDITLWFAGLLPDVERYKLDRKANNIYNVGTGVSTTFRKMLDLFIENLEHKYSVSKNSSDIEEEYLTNTSGYQKYTRANISKLRAAGWERPFVTPEEGVARYFETFGN